MPPTGPMNSYGPQGRQGPGPQGPPPVDTELGVHCTIVVSKLLDVPVERGVFVKEPKTYQLRVMDSKRKELARSEEIQGLDDSQLQGRTTQTFGIPEELGTLHAKTLSKTVQVEAWRLRTIMYIYVLLVVLEREVHHPQVQSDCSLCCSACISYFF